MNKTIDSTLRTVFVIQVLSSGILGALSVIVPAFIIGLSGLDLAATPAIQQAGGLTMGYTLGAIMSLRATTWEEVKIFVYASFVAFAFGLVGAAYYIFLVGVVAVGLIIILVSSLIMVIGLGYAIYQHRGTQSVAIKSSH
jgi:hypothetical protein